MKTLISFPRSGAHWLMALVETGLGHEVDWQHLHDIRFFNWWEMPPHYIKKVDTLEDGTFKPYFRVTDLEDGFKPLTATSTLEIAREEDHSFKIDELVFLYRKDLPSLVYSRLKLFGYPITKENVLRIVIAYSSYTTEWEKFISNYDKPVLTISYEDLSENTQETLEYVLEFYKLDKEFTSDFDPKSVGKKEVAEHIARRWPDNSSGKHGFSLVRHDKEYLEQRSFFMEEFEDYINSLYQFRDDLPSIDLLRSTRRIEYEIGQKES